MRAILIGLTMLTLATASTPVQSATENNTLWFFNDGLPATVMIDGGTVKSVSAGSDFTRPNFPEGQHRFTITRRAAMTTTLTFRASNAHHGMGGYIWCVASDNNTAVVLEPKQCFCRLPSGKGAPACQ